jgi:large subunit ribosomal protein L25
MDVITLQAQARPTGKKAARATRRDGQVPCVLYGHHVEPVVFQVPEMSLKPLIFTDEFHRVAVEMDGQSWDCIVKHIDFHPVGDHPIHVDFQVLRADEQVTLMVPVQFKGVASGQRVGGHVEYFLHEIEITCLPADLPDHIEVDISPIELGQTLHVSDLKAPGITFGLALDQPVVSVQTPRKGSEEEAAA